MKLLLPPALALGLLLIACERPTPPAAATPPPAAPADDGALREARDALARQAMEIETRSALLDKQLADLEARLKQSENEALRTQLDQLKQQNDQLRSQAETTRKQSEALTRRLASSRPAAVSVSAAPPIPRDLSIFHDRLAPHGRWVEMNGYGLCFQPRLARSHAWRPYVDGRWSWSSLGWTWQTSEPFGWATYHYGRWVNLTTHGWLWVPGCEWAPAWVAWRQSRDHIGWAPLPPESGSCGIIQRDCDTRYRLGPASYTFVRTTHFVRPTYITCIQPITYNTTIFQQSINVTRITPCGGNQGGTPLYMHHGGPLRQQVEQACQQPVPQSQLRPIDPAIAVPIPSQNGPAESPAPIIDIVQLPPATPDKQPDLKAEEQIEKNLPVNPYAGVPAGDVAAIQQSLDAEAKKTHQNDSTGEIIAAPASGAGSTTAAPPASLAAGQAAMAPSETRLVASLGAPVETRGSEPETSPAAALSTALSKLIAASPADQPSQAGATSMILPAIKADLVPNEPPATPEIIKMPAASAQGEETARGASEQQAQIEAAQRSEAVAATQRVEAEEASRQAQMETQRQAEEAQRQAQMEAQRQAEEAQRQAQMEAQRQAEEAQRQAQMEAQRQAEEAQRQAQMEAQRQAQMEAQRQAEEAQRQAQMEAQRQAQMEAQRQAQMEAQRQAQMEAQRQAQMEAQRQAEEAARQAAQQPSPTPL